MHNTDFTHNTNDRITYNKDLYYVETEDSPATSSLINNGSGKEPAGAEKDLLVVEQKIAAIDSEYQALYGRMLDLEIKADRLTEDRVKLLEDVPADKARHIKKIAEEYTTVYKLGTTRTRGQ